LGSHSVLSGFGCSVLSGLSCQSAVVCRFGHGPALAFEVAREGGCLICLFWGGSWLAAFSLVRWVLFGCFGSVSRFWVSVVSVRRHCSYHACSLSVWFSCSLLLCGFFLFKFSLDSSHWFKLVGCYVSVLFLFLLFWAVVCVFFFEKKHPCHGRCVGKLYLVVVAVHGAPRHYHRHLFVARYESREV
jgi:hypothetical protein